ncbi:MAG TPA: response regulator transcription factor [Microbacteriaceae bacterium]|nr:response regulator transcription factor [Microbacteriaceae bacterium]
MKVLLIEDDPSIATSVADGLSDVAISAHHVASGSAALDALGRDRYDCVLLDLGLPDMDGMDVCRAIQARGDVPIIVISARDTELDRVLALEMGADDYLVKPFGMRELIARIRAVVRRRDASPRADEQVVTIGELVVDSRRQSATLAGDPVHFTPKEFAILSYLMRDSGAVYRRSDIIRDVWDTDWVGGSKSLDAHIASIRKKLTGSVTIQAVHGVGFRIEAES